MVPTPHRISASTNARGHTTRYVRDALGRPTRITLIPYFTFHNRGDAPFTVWMPLVERPAAPAK